jgi:putative heme iron utilization protein
MRMPEQENPFDNEVVAAVVAHMNADHVEDSLVICRVFGDLPELTSAVMVGLDGDGADFEVDGPGGSGRVRVRWSEPISDRPRIREEIARLFHEAETRSGGG